MKYTSFEISKFEGNGDAWLFESLAEHVGSFLGENWHPLTNAELIEGLPMQAKNVYYVWWFAAEVGGSGIYDYVVNQLITGTELWLTYNALKQIGFDDLVNRLHSAISLSKDESAYFWETVVVDEFKCFVPTARYQSFEAIDDNIYELVQAPLATKATEYIRKNAHLL